MANHSNIEDVEFVRDMDENMEVNFEDVPDEKLADEESYDEKHALTNDSGCISDRSEDLMDRAIKSCDKCGNPCSELSYETLYNTVLLLHGWCSSRMCYVHD